MTTPSPISSRAPRTALLAFAAVVTMILVSGSVWAQGGAPAADFANDAAPPPDPYWFAQIPEGVVDGAPNQPVAITAYMQGQVVPGTRDAVTGLPYVSVTVTDSATMMPVTGTLSYQPEILSVLWTADAPLTTGSSYAVAVLFENERMATEWATNSSYGDILGGFTLEVGAETAPLTEPSVLSSALLEYESFGTSCCDAGEFICEDAGGCFQCISYSVAAPQLDLRYASDAPGPPFVWYTVYVVAPDGSEVAQPGVLDVASGEQRTSIYFESIQTEYCVRIEAHSLSGETASTSLCVDDTERETSGLPEPDLSPLELCAPNDNPTMDPGADVNADAENVGSDDCSCSIRASQPAGLPTTALLLLLGIAALWSGLRLSRAER